MTPRGKLLSHNEIKRLLSCEGLVIITSRYEGIDERVNIGLMKKSQLEIMC